MCYMSVILKRRSRDEQGPSSGQEGQTSLDDAIDEAVDGLEDGPMAGEEEDRFDVMAAEIADLLRTAKVASHRLEAESAVTAQATIDEANDRAATLVAEAEARAEAQTRESAALLDEATTLLERARVRDVAIRGEADQYAAAKRAELTELVATASRAKQSSADTLEKSRKVLSDAEQELTKAIEQATEVLAALTAIRAAAAPVEAEQQALESETPETIDLTDSAAEASGEKKQGDESAEKDGDDLDQSLRTAVAKAVEQTSGSQEPET